jgi:hypothetical protein
MLVPELLKNAQPMMKVGWFLHTPFPSSGKDGSRLSLASLSAVYLAFCFLLVLYSPDAEVGWFFRSRLSPLNFAFRASRTRDLPDAAAPRGGAQGDAQRRPHRFPHLRLRASLCLGLHADPRPRGAASAATTSVAPHQTRRPSYSLAVVFEEQRSAWLSLLSVAAR